MAKREYVNGPQLKAALSEWKRKCEATGQVLPLPEYVGECIVLIAKRLSLKPGFLRYTFREDMAAEGVLMCCKYIHNFNPNLPNANAFAYITQILSNSFVRYIQVEQKQAYVKAKMIQDRQWAVLGDGEYEIDPLGANDPDAPHMQIIAKYEARVNTKKEKTLATKKLKGSEVADVSVVD